MFNQKNNRICYHRPTSWIPKKHPGKGFGQLKMFLKKLILMKIWQNFLAKTWLQAFYLTAYFYPHDHKLANLKLLVKHWLETKMFWRDSQILAIQKALEQIWLKKLNTFWMKILLLSTTIKSLAQENDLNLQLPQMVSTPSSWLVWMLALRGFYAWTHKLKCHCC